MSRRPSSWSRSPLSKTQLIPEEDAGAFALLAEAAARIKTRRDKGAGWLDRQNAGTVSPALADAQRTLDRAVEGGFFDAFDGRPAVGESMAEVRRAMLDEAATLLDDPSVEVCIAEDEFDCPLDGRRKWRTRLVATPREG